MYELEQNPPPAAHFVDESIKAFSTTISRTPLLSTAFANLWEYTGNQGATGEANEGEAVTGVSTALCTAGQLRMFTKNPDTTVDHDVIADVGEHVCGHNGNWTRPYHIYFECKQHGTVWRCFYIEGIDLSACASRVLNGQGIIKTPKGKLSIIAFVDVETDAGNGHFMLKTDEAHTIRQTSGWAWRLTGAAA